MATPSRTCKGFVIGRHHRTSSRDQFSREIYRNETDYKAKGSLMWILNHTTTKFGARMLKSWIGRPLTDTTCVYKSKWCGSLLIPNFRMLRERTDAVEEILETSSAKLTVLRQLLRGLPDLARGLCRIQYGKVRCSLRSQGLSEGLTFRSSVHPSGTCGASTGIQ